MTARALQVVGLVLMIGSVLACAAAPAASPPATARPGLTPAAASAAPAASVPAASLPGNQGGAPQPQYEAICNTATPTLDGIADELEGYSASTDNEELALLLDDVSAELLFIEDTGMDTALLAGAALTAVAGISAAITEGEPITDLVGPAAAAVRALEAHVCG